MYKETTLWNFLRMLTMMIKLSVFLVYFVHLAFSKDDILELDKRWVDVPLEECKYPTYHLCRDSMNCIYGQYVCDGSRDCREGDDEDDCSKHPCPEEHIKCSDSGACIAMSRVCNGCFDCKDGSDEADCPSYNSHCVGKKFYCKTGDSCIPAMWACDGVTGQCPGDEDEWCDVTPTQEVFLDNRVKEKIISFDIKNPGTRPVPDLNSPKLLVRSWRVKSSKIIYLKPLNVSLGAVCGPSMIEILEGNEKVADICGNSVPPWHLASVNSSFIVKFKFFNDFGGDDSRSFSLKFWVSSV